MSDTTRLTNLLRAIAGIHAAKANANPMNVTAMLTAKNLRQIAASIERDTAMMEKAAVVIANGGLIKAYAIAVGGPVPDTAEAFLQMVSAAPKAFFGGNSMGAVTLKQQRTLHPFMRR